MNRALTIPLVLILSMPLLAGEPKAADEPKKNAEPATEAAAPTAQADSPMVQAMRRANRRGKPAAKVITNETIRNSKGHVTTTTVQRPVNIPEPQLTPYEIAAKNAAEKREQDRKIREIGAADAKKAAADRERSVAVKAQRAEEGLYEELDDDPAQSEREADEEVTQKPPQI